MTESVMNSQSYYVKMLSSAFVQRPPLHNHQSFLPKTLTPCLYTLQALTSSKSQCHLQNPSFFRTQQSIANRGLSLFIVTAKSPVSSDLSEQKFSQEGLVIESLPNGMFRIRLDNSDTIIGYISGKIRKSFIRILPGDRVKVEVSRYDTTRGRIVYRLRNNRDSS